MTANRKTMGVPYAGATTGIKAREEITRVFRHFGCEAIGFMDDFEKHEVLLAFKHRGRQVQFAWTGIYFGVNAVAHAKGWAQHYLKQRPWNDNRHTQRRNGSRPRFSRGISRSTAFCAIGQRHRSLQSSAACFRSKQCSCRSCSP